jgi:hypothetical protein
MKGDREQELIQKQGQAKPAESIPHKEKTLKKRRVLNQAPDISPVLVAN